MTMYEGSYSGYAIQPKIHWNNEQITKHSGIDQKQVFFFVSLSKSVDLTFL